MSRYSTVRCPNCHHPIVDLQVPTITQAAPAPPTHPPEDQLLTLRDVSELLKVKEGWIYDRVQDGTFPAVRLGRQLRFEPGAIRKYLAENTAVEDAAAGVSPPPAPRRGRPRKY